jgi:hypothetical protein
VEKAVIVHVRERGERLTREGQRRRQGERRACGDHLPQIDSAQPLHHQEPCAVLGEQEVERPDDIRVRQTGDHAGLAKELFASPRIDRQARPHHLEDPFFAELTVARAEEGAHPPLGQRAEDLVALLEAPETAAGDRRGALDQGASQTLRARRFQANGDTIRLDQRPHLREQVGVVGTAALDEATALSLREGEGFDQDGGGQAVPGGGRGGRGRGHPTTFAREGGRGAGVSGGEPAGVAEATAGDGPQHVPRGKQSRPASGAWTTHADRGPTESLSKDANTLSGNNETIIAHS